MTDESVPQRRWDDREPGLKIGWGSRYLHAKGASVVFLLGVACVVGAIVWSGEQQRREAERTREVIVTHDLATASRISAQWESLRYMQEQLTRAMRLQTHQMDVQNCIGLYDFNERRQFRGRAGWIYDACPWIARPADRTDQGQLSDPLRLPKSDR